MRQLRVIISFLFASAIGYFFYQELLHSSLTTIKNIEIIGAQPSTLDRIQKLHGVTLGSSFWKVGVEDIVNRLRMDPWIENVVVKRVFPDKIEIKINEREPKAVLSGDGRQFNFVDKNNVVFGPAPLKKLESHVILSGDNILKDSVLRKKTLEVFDQLPREGILSHEDVSELKYLPEKGYQVILSRSGMVIELGKESIPLHLDRARKVVQYLEQHQINASHVDADYAKKVLVKVRKDR